MLWGKLAVKKLHDTDVAEISPLRGPDEKKKVRALPVSEYGDLDVANTIWII